MFGTSVEDDVGRTFPVDGILVAALALLIGVPLMAALAVKVAASIPADEPDPTLALAGPTPRLPGWIARTWLLGALAVPMLLFAYTTSPTSWIFWWSVAGPFTLEHFGSSSMSEAVVSASLLLVMMAAHPAQPNRVTAALSILAVGVWFMLGFGFIRQAV